MLRLESGHRSFIFSLSLPYTLAGTYSQCCQLLNPAAKEGAKTQLFINGKKISVIKGSLSALSLQEPRTRLFNITDTPKPSYLPIFMSGMCFFIMPMLLAHPGLEEHSTRHFRERQTQHYAAKMPSDNHVLLSETGMQSHSSGAGDFPSIFRVLQCYPLAHTSSPPAGCQLCHSWHRQGAGSCLPFHGGVASISAGLV